jgi:hypothetical protein
MSPCLEMVNDVAHRSDGAIRPLVSWAPSVGAPAIRLRLSAPLLVTAGIRNRWAGASVGVLLPAGERGRGGSHRHAACPLRVGYLALETLKLLGCLVSPPRSYFSLKPFDSNK